MDLSVFGATLLGIDAHPVEIEVRLSRGLMGRFQVTGLPDAAVKESRDRVRAAIAAAGLKFPKQPVLVHLAPGDLRKEGPLLDLPIALAVLAASGQLAAGRLRRFVATGELGLDGRVRAVRGLLPVAAAAHAHGFEALLAPAEGAALAAMQRGLPVYPVTTLAEAWAFLNGALDVTAAQPRAEEPRRGAEPDLHDVRGQDEAKQALVIAAAGLHNLLMVGPPGSGKTMLARRFAALLPDLDEHGSLECSRIHSVVGRAWTGAVVRPPFRAPHHTASPAALIGGGPRLRPGEITLAHHGVLFLDELPEFPRHALEALRQPLEDRVVTVSRAAGSFRFPADFCLVAAMNPCPCGYRGHRKIECRCGDAQVRRYVGRLSGPLLDRIDLCVEVPAVDVQDLLAEAPRPGTSDLRARVVAARAVQRERFGAGGAGCNGRMSQTEVDEFCATRGESRALLLQAADAKRLSARAVMRVLRVARTAADLRGSRAIEKPDVAFALSCRPTLVEVE